MNRVKATRFNLETKRQIVSLVVPQIKFPKYPKSSINPESLKGGQSLLDRTDAR